MSVNFGLKSYIRDANGDGQYTPDEVNSGVSAFSNAQGSGSSQYGGLLLNQAYSSVNVTDKTDPSMAAVSGTLNGPNTQQLTGNGPTTNIGNYEREQPQTQINFFQGNGSGFSFFA